MGSHLVEFVSSGSGLGTVLSPQQPPKTPGGNRNNKSLVFGRGLGGDGAGAEIWSPLLNLHFPCSSCILDSPATSPSWNGVGGRQPCWGIGDSARQMLPSLSSSAYLSRWVTFWERGFWERAVGQTDSFRLKEMDWVASQPTFIASFSVCPESALAQGSGGLGSTEN